MNEGSRNSTGQEEEKQSRDGWDKFAVLARPLSGILAAVTIASVGYFGQKTLTTIASQSESARLFTELQVRREESESALRKDIFNQTLKLLLDDRAKTSAKRDPSKSLLRLELLALNFGDTLSLSPLFSEMDRDMGKLKPENDDEAEDWNIRLRLYKKRLRSLAKRVAGSQVSAVLQKGHDFQIEVPAGYDRLTVFDWPGDAIRHELADTPELLDDEKIFADLVKKKNQIGFDDVILVFHITLYNFNREEKTVRIALTIEQKQKDYKGRFNVLTDTINREFTLNYYNFPMIDNTRLVTNKRFALVMEDFNSNGVSIRGIVFPGQYSSHRDRPFLSDAIEELKKQFKEVTGP